MQPPLQGLKPILNDEKEVLQTLKDTGLDQNTIIVVWGDHGWHLGDHTVWGKHTLFERALRSAFIIKTPNPRYLFLEQKKMNLTVIYKLPF